ncbi:MAG: flagellar M-ring protein FliF [Candidatus Aureabacteria bacterium]|nr:flagellar M-ring protein FliF [Candidatus Auribacterota bacterium]
MGFFENIKRQFIAFWKEVDPSTKLIVMLFLVVLIIAVSVAVSLNMKPHYVLLYASLSESTASEMVKHLEDNNIPYELKNNGKDIYVLKDRVNNVRLMLKNKGLPKEGDNLGFEIFDRKNLGVTDFVQRIQHHRALAGELERTIAKIKGVEGVRVHVVLPEETLFEQDKKESSATVFLNLSYEGVLEGAQIKGIQQLTASSVEGLKPKNVTVVDHYGNVLSPPSEDDGDNGVLSSRINIQKSVEAYYLKKLQTLLDSVLGRNNSVVRVDALLDFDKIEETEEKFDPESAVVRSEIITSEKSSGASNVAKGPPGVESNMAPGKKSSSGSSQENQSNREVINNKYEIDKKVRHIIKAVGDVKKLTVSVFLEQKVKLDKSGKTVLDENGNKTYEPRTAEEMKVFIDIVKNAIGFDEKRGDNVVIKEVPFDKTSRDIFKTMDLKSPHDVNTLIGTLMKLGFSIVVLILFWIMFKKKGGEGGSFIEKKKMKPSGTQPEEEEEENMTDFQSRGLKAVEKRAFIDQEVTKMVDQNQVESERVLKRWLKE